MYFGAWEPFGLLALVIMFVVPVAILVWVANERGQSQAFCLFGLFGWPGMVIGLLLMIALPKNEPWR